MSRIFKALFIVAALLSCSQADAQFFKRLKPSNATVKANNNKNKVVTADPDEHLLTTEIATPVVPDKLANAVKASMMNQAESLHHLGYDVKSTRNGQVLIVTIPTEKMFAPNETALQEVYARQLLEPFGAYLRTPGRYKILLAVHTDDTGDKDYIEKLSDQRALAVSKWFEQNVENVGSVRHYGLGSGDPLAPNISRRNRAKNRRLEIFIVPDVELIQNINSK
ncbi:MAG: OmpA family protein [Muribaculaceae bacterium]|nr:OmpA family protein [Muribaculaceae bacterium]